MIPKKIVKKIFLPTFWLFRNQIWDPPIQPARHPCIKTMSTITHSKKFILKLNLFWYASSCNNLLRVLARKVLDDPDLIWPYCITILYNTIYLYEFCKHVFIKKGITFRQSRWDPAGLTGPGSLNPRWTDNLVVHKDLDNKVPSYLGEINLYTGANYSVQIVQNKLKNKNNMKVEHYYEERNQFYSKGIIWYFWNIVHHT